ncbi:hypothetical protein PFISCL1PPCAC_1314, partial [Pristionchus fissidentatus]
RMSSALSLALLACLASLLVIVSCNPAKPLSAPASCGVDEYREMPCVCCKKSCWYTIASAATHELGHMPGEAGEAEAMATLRLIRACMIADCSDVCPSPRRPF